VRVANLAGRSVLLTDCGALDVHRASDGRFGADPMDPFVDWDAFREWAAGASLSTAEPYDLAQLEAPVPAPSQVFAIGLNYRDHARESQLPEPEHLLVFTKFASCLSGPTTQVALTSETVDYETELVVVIGRRAHRVAEADAWDVVAGLSVGQDITDRGLQWRGPAPQFSLGKSLPGFGPFGPAIVTLDEIPDSGALGVRATITREDGSTEQVQDGTTADLIFSVPQIIASLSSYVTLLPGDLVFTGTPAGVGAARGRYLAEGDVLVSEIDHLGALRNEFRW
jgi:2,4-diketo-3-deoxy-L-fuconate hydrolase